MKLLWLVVVCVIIKSSFAIIPKGVAIKEWWEKAVFYQIYPRSFADSNGDGIGDIKGITSKLLHLKDAGVDATWLSPVFKSPMVDFGYDVSDFKTIDPLFGTMEDFDELFKVAKNLGIKIILDFVPNHTSDQHDWFIKSENRVAGYEDYYIWNDGKPNPAGGRNLPPNNWVAVFRGKAWKWSDIRQQYYYHQFAEQQPDLNYRNPKVVEEMKDVLRFWLEKGADGFRIDAINHLMEIEDLRDEPRNLDQPDELSYGYVFHHYTLDMMDTYDKVYEFRDVLNTFQKDNGGETRILLTEAYTNLSSVMRYYQSDDGSRQGSHMPFNFLLVLDVDKESTAENYKYLIDRWLENLPSTEKTANWVLGNHDRPRVGSRFGVEFIGAMNTLSMTLPGVAVTYYGEEIGMLDYRDITWEDTVDPQACNTNNPNPDIYKSYSRDPQRTPFQWDDSPNAGFSTADKTWLPMHPDYKTNNLKLQKATGKSHFQHYKQLTRIRKFDQFVYGNFEMKSLQTKVLAYKRELEGNEAMVVVINLGGIPAHVNLTEFENLSNDFIVELSTISSNFKAGDLLSSIFNIQAYDALILRNIVSEETTVPTTDITKIPTTQVAPTTTKVITTTPNAGAYLTCSVLSFMMLIAVHILF